MPRWGGQRPRLAGAGETRRAGFEQPAGVMLVGWVALLPGALAVLVPDECDELADGGVEAGGQRTTSCCDQEHREDPAQSPVDAATTAAARGGLRGDGRQGGIREGSEWIGLTGVTGHTGGPGRQASPRDN